MNVETPRARRLGRRLDAIGHIHLRNDLSPIERTRRLVDLKIKARKEAEHDRRQPELKHRVHKFQSNNSGPETDFPISDDESTEDGETDAHKIQELRIKSLVRRCTQLELDAKYWKDKFAKESGRCSGLLAR